MTIEAPRVGVITFPGSLDDRDALRAVDLMGGEGVPLWHADHDLHEVDAVVLPGGFSYGDYLRCGAIAGHAPILDEVKAFAENAARSDRHQGLHYLVARPAGVLPGIEICDQARHAIRLNDQRQCARQKQRADHRGNMKKTRPGGKINHGKNCRQHDDRPQVGFEKDHAR